ncbi:unnamed protein product [Absidia cylindrospora]
MEYSSFSFGSSSPSSNDSSYPSSSHAASSSSLTTSEILSAVEEENVSVLTMKTWPNSKLRWKVDETIVYYSLLYFQLHSLAYYYFIDYCHSHPH